jgi:iron(II)-dependent oxidoreductase
MLIGGAAAVVVLLAGLAWYLTRGKIDPKPPTGSGQGIVPPGMVRIPGAEFMLGRNDGSEYDFPAHKVSVKSFLIDETELTNDEYQQYIDATRSQPPRHWTNGRYAMREAQLPVVNVTWFEASNYCASLGKRLPTEEEWEYAAKGNDERRYPYGNEWLPSRSNAAEDDLRAPRPVRTYPDGKSPFGIYDMAGNVQEWTSSEFKAYPGSKLTEEQKAANAGRKVLRGGAYQARKEFQTTTERFFYLPSTANEYTGFRCAKDAQ